MSHTTLYRVPSSGEIEEVAEYQNSHGSAAFIWSELCEHYFGDRSMWLLSGQGAKRLWALGRDISTPLVHRIALATTYDRVMVRRENIHRVVDAFMAFVKQFPPGDYACSLMAQCDDLLKLAKDERCYAVCWNQTSVCDHWCSPRHADNDEPNYYWDITKDEGHWFLFDELPMPQCEVSHAER